MPQRPKTKIVCTLGPATKSYDMICQLILSGLTVARLNLSHGTSAEHQVLFRTVRKASSDLGIPVGIMVDIPGPKYRTGPQSPGDFDLNSGDTVALTSRDITGNPKMLGVYPSGIHNDAVVGGRVLVDDGAITLEVVSVASQDVECMVLDGGRITEGRGVTTPGRAPTLPLLDYRAMHGLSFAASAGADFVALSNITKSEDVYTARQLLQMRGSTPFIISKIETAEAINDFDSILDASDGIMVARGDMGVEIEMEAVPAEQKRIISKCNIAGKPVITATQMLESMVASSQPTRAEVTDVANAVYDGTDAIMLSGETSIGQYPDRAVDVMRKIALRTETALDYERIIEEKGRSSEQQTDDAISYAAANIANQMSVGAIVAFTESGSTARRVSRYRPRPPILALTPHESVQRELTLSWGVTPVIGPTLTNLENLFDEAEERAISHGALTNGDKLVLTAGTPLGVPGSTNFLYVMDVSADKGKPSD